MLTNGYAAEYGRYAAGVVDVVTKSGSNTLHGAAFEFFRNQKLNAKRWTPPGVTAAKDPLDRNQFDGAFIYSADDIREALGLDSTIPVTHLDARDPRSSRDALVALIDARLNRPVVSA